MAKQTKKTKKVADTASDTLDQISGELIEVSKEIERETDNIINSKIESAVSDAVAAKDVEIARLKKDIEGLRKLCSESVDKNKELLQLTKEIERLNDIIQNTPSDEVMKREIDKMMKHSERQNTVINKCMESFSYIANRQNGQSWLSIPEDIVKKAQNTIRYVQNAFPPQ